MNSKFLHKGPARPWLLGSYAVYAQNIHVARQVYEYARAQGSRAPFGTMELETGEIIDWIDITYGVVRQRSHD
jgi:hypothetical protein